MRGRVQSGGGRGCIGRRGPDLHARAALRDPHRQSPVRSARAIGLELSTRRERELDYKPRIIYPLNLTLWDRGEKITVKFESAVEGGTHVTISGTVAKSKQTTASDPKHWSEALAGSSSA
jgi:hypothetical protein